MSKKKKKQQKINTDFSLWMKELGKDERIRLSVFFGEISAHLQLAKKEKQAIIEDYESAMLSLVKKGYSVEEITERLDPVRLGGFYARPAVAWYPLDDAAKIYPLSMKQGRMAVFRLSVSLKEAVIPEILQMALTFTIGRFPSFATTVKNGFFWHYLDARKMRYAVEPEKDVPCRPLTVSRSGSQSFRVVYYENRISVEFFHILTDGSGGLVFLKTLVAEYLQILGVKDLEGEGILKTEDPHRGSETENAFLRAEKPENANGFADRIAVQLGGKISSIRPCRILHFKFDSKELLEKAREEGATVTAYLLSKMFLAAKSATDVREGEFSMQVPVNMRKFYPSDTLRNFSMYCGIRIPVDKVKDGREMTEEIMNQLKEKTSKDCMSAMMFSAKQLVSMLRLVPLAIKAPVARYIYSYLGENIFTSTLSNIGVVDLPKGMAENIDSMDFVLGTAAVNRASCALISCNEKSVLSISKQTVDPSFEEAMYRLFKEDGLDFELEGSERYDG